MYLTQRKINLTKNEKLTKENKLSNLFKIEISFVANRIANI